MVSGINTIPNGVFEFISLICKMRVVYDTPAIHDRKINSHYRTIPMVS